MTTQMAEYKNRNINEWLEMASTGALALPDFQRSWVWTPRKIRTYLKALFENRPTGTLLILESADQPQFGSRTFNGMSPRTNQAKELVLDGQQRLTALWKALGGEDDTEHRFYLKARNLKNRDLGMVDVVMHSLRTKLGVRIENPEMAYADNLVPFHILRNAKDDDGLGEIWHWCHQACGNGEALDVQLLNEAIRRDFREPFLFDRKLWYCNLDKSTEANVAVDVFVESNSSSVAIRRFDIVVALARGTHDEDLRNRIHDGYQSNEVLRNYFKSDPEDWIPSIGEWMLKVACLKTGIAPKESKYDSTLDYLVEGDNMDALFRDLGSTLTFVAREGSPTMRTVPSWPPLHVLAALQQQSATFSEPAKIGLRDKLLSAYYWRSLFSNRHETQANDRLLEDYHDLGRCLDQIETSGRVTERLPGVFDDDAHPVLAVDDLIRGVPWISRTRYGLALAALVTRRVPLDWATGQKFDVQRVRDLDGTKRLDRHHVFPRDVLRREGIGRTRIQHGLNGVLLDRVTNRKFSKFDPRKYFEEVLETDSEDELRKRVESHLVPYDVIWSAGAVKERYQAYIEARAELVSEEIKKLVAV